ncbi:MAG: DNA polymerase I [Clostridia bacterium]|nr:DNA polymerase I [Clostridia bacterium]
MEKLLILDGNSIINRAFYGVRLLSNGKGQYTNGVYGFLNIFLKILEETEYTYQAVAFDLKAPTFRHKMFDGYKAQRKGMPEELAEQMPYLKNILKLMGIPILELEGYEADDIIGTVSKMCEQKNTECVILTGDKDDLQLASDLVTVRLVVTKGGNTETNDFDGKAVLEKMSVTPEAFIDVKALMGDTSDNIPGVPGIGEKTAFSLIAEYGSLDGVYEHIEDFKGAKKEKLIAGKDSAYMSKTLATIVRDVPLNKTLEDLKPEEADKGKLFDYLNELELKSIISRLSLSAQENATTLYTAETKEIASPEELNGLISEKVFYTLEWEDGFITKLLIAGENKVYTLSFAFAAEVMPYLPALKKLFEQTEKVSVNIKEQIVFLKENLDIQYSENAFDIALAAYISKSSEQSYALADLASRYLNKTVAEEVSEVALMPEIYECLKAELTENGQDELFYGMEMPLAFVLADMEIEGFKVDRDSLSAFSKLLSENIDSLQKEIYALAGKEFNINSPKQLGVVLFEDLNLPVIKKTKSGYSTNADVLEKLRGAHEIIDKITDYRTYTKLKSTYADGLYQVIRPETGKIHSSFNQTVTATGRISSTEPNLQNIPVRIELGRQIRKMFIASDADHILVDADYSQIELRVLAHIANDKTMQEAFLNNVDIHAVTASQVFHVPLDEVTPAMRTRAKAVNFGIVYGISEFSLAQDIHVTRKEAAAYMERYFETYSGIAKYMKETVAFAKEHGYVKTLTGRRRYIPEIKASNFNLRSFGERVAMNAPIQGYAADIIKIAMVKVHNRLKEEGLSSKLILQVHDELIIDALKCEEEQVKKILREEMEKAAILSIPLTVEMKSGNSWYETK